jgi:hypothetical protein
MACYGLGATPSSSLIAMLKQVYGVALSLVILGALLLQYYSLPMLTLLLSNSSTSGDLF